MELEIINPIVQRAESLEIEKQADLPQAVQMLSELNKTADKITEEKEKITKPLNEALKQERNRWKPIETVLEQAINTLRTKITKYQTAQIAIEKAQQEKIAARLEKGTLTLPTAVRRLADLKISEKSVNSEAGYIKFRVTKKFIVENLELVPRDYLIINEALIKEAMKDQKEIPGIRYYEEQTPINYR